MKRFVFKLCDACAVVSRRGVLSAWVLEASFDCSVDPTLRQLEPRPHPLHLMGTVPLIRRRSLPAPRQINAPQTLEDVQP